MSPSERAGHVWGHLRPFLATAALLALVTGVWAGLWRNAPMGALAGAVIMCAAPSIVRVLPIPRVGLVSGGLAVVGAALTLTLSVGGNLRELIGADGDVWARIGDIIPVGLGNAATTTVPLAQTGSESLSALLVLVLGGGAALVSWQILVSRRPLPAIIAAATGMAYCWTLVRPDHPVALGLLTLGVCMLVLRLGVVPRRGWRGAPGRGLVAGSLVLAVAALGSMGIERDSGAWWNWRSWTFGAAGNSTTLTLQQRYGPLNYPENPVLLARLTAPRALPLRLVAYERFDPGLSAFVEQPATVDDEDVNGTLELAGQDPADEPETTTATVTVTRTKTPFLLVPGRPTTITKLGSRTVQIWDDGTLGVDPAIGPNASYQVETIIPDPGADNLLGDTVTGASGEFFVLSVGGGREALAIPPFGSGVPLPPVASYGQYADVAQLSRDVIGNAKTPYAAVNRIEKYLRSPANYSYDEKAPRAVGQPELVSFLLTTKEGYCQQFAGSMALMLRMNGIPARVVVGLSTGAGRYDSATGSYGIVDRDAHSWVEVGFDRYGWLPFDPTPGRSAPNSASVSSPEYRVSSQTTTIDPEISATPVNPPAREIREPPASEVTSDSGASDAGTGFTTWLGVGLAAALLLGLVPVLFKAGRRVRRRHGGERERVLGAARELESLLMDAGHHTDPAASATERGERLWREMGVDARTIYGLAAEARFSPHEPTPGAGVSAWSQLALARRRLGWRRRLVASLRMRSLRRR